MVVKDTVLSYSSLTSSLTSCCVCFIIVVPLPNLPDISAIHSTTLTTTHIDETMSTTRRSSTESQFTTMTTGSRRSSEQDINKTMDATETNCDALVNCKVWEKYCWLLRLHFIYWFVSLLSCRRLCTLARLAIDIFQYWFSMVKVHLINNMFASLIFFMSC